MFGKIQQCSHLFPWAFLVGSILIILKIKSPLLVISHLRLFFQDSDLVGCMFLGYFSISLDCFICWDIIVHSWLMILCISVASVVMPLPSSMILFESFDLFLINVKIKSLSILFIFSKSQPWVLLTFIIIFLISISLISALISVTALLLLTLGFISSLFLVPRGVKPLLGQGHSQTTAERSWSSHRAALESQLDQGWRACLWGRGEACLPLGAWVDRTAPDWWQLKGAGIKS